MNYIIRPLGEWLDPVTEDRRSASAFRATWDDTLALLGWEVELLGGDQIVLQVDVTEVELRRDGMLRTHAEVKFPGVRVSFASVHGPLTYATDAYEARYSGGLNSWQANVRAIALGLVALRAVDRYGVSGRGQQYRGWNAIAARPEQMTPETAADFIAHWSGDAQFTGAGILADPMMLSRAYWAAARRVSPESGHNGNPADRSYDTLTRLNLARDLLKGAQGV